MCGIGPQAASSPRRSSCMILPGCSSRKTLSCVPCAAARNCSRRLRPAQVEQQRLEADEDQLAPERRHEPGQAGQSGDAVAVDHREQHAQVVLAAAQHAVHLLVVGEDVGGPGVPALVVVRAARRASRVEVAVAAAGGAPGADDLHVVARVGALARRQAQAEAGPALLDATPAARAKRDDRLAHHVVQAEVGERQRCPSPPGRQPRAAPPAPQAAHLEQVGEVGVEVHVEHAARPAAWWKLRTRRCSSQAVGDEARAAHVHARLRQHAPVRRCATRGWSARWSPRSRARRSTRAAPAAAGHGELEAAQVARVPVVQAERRVLARRASARASSV